MHRCLLKVQRWRSPHHHHHHQTTRKPRFTLICPILRRTKGTIVRQSMTRCLFQLSRRDRELLPFSLMLRDEIENFFPSVSCFETRSRISSLRSHASRRDREFLSSLSCFETRPRRMLKKLHFCWGIASIIISPDNITLAFTFVKMSLFNRTLCEEGESESGFWRSGQNLAHSCTRWSTQIPDEQ